MAFLTDSRSASNYAFFDSHVECFPLLPHKTRRNVRFWNWMLRFFKKGSKSLYPNKYTLYSLLMHTKRGLVCQPYFCFMLYQLQAVSQY
jgi:prepilin-type processing-associated H-X9-DG protein